MSRRARKASTASIAATYRPSVDFDQSSRLYLWTLHVRSNGMKELYVACVLDESQGSNGIRARTNRPAGIETEP